MAVYYKFKSAKYYDSITIDGHFILVINLKERIFESKRLGRGTDFDLIVTNAQTNEEYLDEAMLIPINTSVLIRRVPGLPRMPIVILPAESKVETKVEDDQLAKSNFMTADSSFEASDFDDEFGDDIYATIPEVTTRKSNILMRDSTPPNESDEDSKIKALIESSGFEWQSQAADGFVQGRDFVRGGGGGRGFGRGCGLPQKTPPRGYICHRCNIPGHYIQHCPTNGDPNFDIRKVKPTTGIPKSMVEPAPDGLYVLPRGASAVLKPNEAAFGKEVEGISSSRSMVDLPPELHCPLCNEVMKDAVCTSKCCYKSFCDKCIRDYIISKSMCFCEAKNILADDLLPNKTVRDTINRILESGNSSADNVSSSVHVQDLESARCLPPKIPSPTQSAASNREQKLPSNVNDSRNVKEKPDVLKVTHKSARVNEHVSQSGALPVEEAQQKLVAGDTGKKKRKKMSLPPNGADMQGMAMQPGMDGYAGPSNFYPHLQGMQSQINGYMGPFVGNMPYNMGYNLDPIAVPWANVMPPELVEPQNFIYPPQRYLAVQVGVGMNVRSPLLNREEFEAEARRPVVRRNGEMERQFEKRELPGDHGFREHSSNATKVLSMKSKPKPLDCYEIHRERDGGHDRLQKRERSSLDHHWEQDRYHDSHDHHRWSSHSHGSNSASQERLDKDTPRSSLKRKEEHHELEHDYDSSQEHARVQEHDRKSQLHDHRHRSKSDAAQAELDRKQKAGVLSSRISFPKEEPPKKPKLNHHTTTALPSLAAAMDYESSYDDERHLKRKPLRYEPSPLPREKWLGADEEAWMWRHSHKIKC